MLRNERGYTLVELLTVMAILSLVSMAIITLYISGVRTQATENATFSAQTSLHVGLEKMRADVHLACSETAQSGTSVTLSLPVSSADFFTGGSVFTYTAQNSPSGSHALPRLHVDITLNTTPAKTTSRYHVVDDIVFENGLRS
jgi:prepilin-type N-terminal cleavage/methylation domain-containing protein